MNVRLLVFTAVFVGFVGQTWATEVSVADSVRKYRFLAKTARDKKEYTDAVKYYRELLKYLPEDEKIHYRLGELCYRIKDFDGARQALTQAVARDSLYINANILLYNLYIKNEERADSAASCLERVLQVKPDDMEKRLNLADLYRREGEIEPAIGHYKALVDQVAEADELIDIIAVLYEDLGKTEEALTWRQRLVDNGDAETSLSEQREALETMARLQLETGDVKSAFETLLELARIDSANRYSYYSRITTLAEERNDAPMRLKGWEGMVRANSRDLETVSKLVEWYLNDGKVKPAEKWLERGLVVETGNAHLLLLKGDILVLREDEEGALAAFEKAMSDPRWETVAQQRIWQIRPPETEEEKLKKAFFGKKDGEEK